MRFTALAIILFAFANSLLGQDIATQSTVRMRLLRIELDSYFRAYSVACEDLRELEKQIAQSSDPEAQKQLDGRRLTLREHLASLARAADEKATLIADLDTEAQDDEVGGAALRPNIYLRRWLKSTHRELDIGIEGVGFFQAVGPASDSIAYTRFGKLDIDKNGVLVIGDPSRGMRIVPTIRVPVNTTSVRISANGSVDVKIPGEIERQNLGRVKIAVFANPNHLLQVSENFFEATPQSGAVEIENPGAGGAGRIVQGTIEISDSEQIRRLIDELFSLLDIRHRQVVDVEGMRNH